MNCKKMRKQDFLKRQAKREAVDLKYMKKVIMMASNGDPAAKDLLFKDCNSKLPPNDMSKNSQLQFTIPNVNSNMNIIEQVIYTFFSVASMLLFMVFHLLRTLCA
jgi:hypothetical protein